MFLTYRIAKYKKLKKLEEEQHSSIFSIDTTGSSYPHITIVAYGAVRTDSTKTHIIVVAWKIQSELTPRAMLY